MHPFSVSLFCASTMVGLQIQPPLTIVCVYKLYLLTYLLNFFMHVVNASPIAYSKPLVRTALMDNLMNRDDGWMAHCCREIGSSCRTGDLLCATLPGMCTSFRIAAVAAVQTTVV